MDSADDIKLSQKKMGMERVDYPSLGSSNASSSKTNTTTTGKGLPKKSVASKVEYPSLGNYSYSAKPTPKNNSMIHFDEDDEFDKVWDHIMYT